MSFIKYIELVVVCHSGRRTVMWRPNSCYGRSANLGLLLTLSSWESNKTMGRQIGLRQTFTLPFSKDGHASAFCLDTFYVTDLFQLTSASEFCSFIDWLDFDNWHIWKKTIIIEIIEGEYPFIMAFLISRHLNIISNIKQVKRAEYIIEIFSS